MTNPKIEKIDADIEKTKKNILRQQAKLRGLERQRKIEEDAEIVAFYRREILPDKNLSELVANQAMSRQKSGGSPAGMGETGEGEYIIEESEVRV